MIPATTKPLVAQDSFVENIGGKGPVKILWVGDNFKQRFWGKTEKPMGATTLRCAKLMGSSIDDRILKELCDEPETTLAQMFRLLELQANGEEGYLLINVSAGNMFHIRDVNNELQVVGVDWLGDGWRIYVYLVPPLVSWKDDRLLFSGNPRT